MLEGIKNKFTEVTSALTGGKGSGIFKNAFNMVTDPRVLGAGLSFGIAKFALGQSMPVSLGLAVAGAAAGHFLSNAFKNKEPAPAPATTQTPAVASPSPTPPQ